MSRDEAIADQPLEVTASNLAVEATTSSGADGNVFAMGQFACILLKNETGIHSGRRVAASATGLITKWKKSCQLLCRYHSF